MNYSQQLEAARKPSHGAGPTCRFDSAQVLLRDFPFPFKAALTVCSDIDETRTTREFLAIQRFLNTTDETDLGEGIGLEIGNSFFFYNQKKEFSYFDHDESARRVIVAMIQSGYIDCLHSYGDTNSREEIARALDSLQASDCRLEVWINHFGVSNDVCRKFEYMFQHCDGDNPDADVYHWDLTADIGIRFAWVGATTRVVGQSATGMQGSLSTVFDSRHPWISSKSVLKELRKQILGRRNDDRYIIHQQNELTRPLQLADGRQVHEFMRYCDHPEGIPIGATSRGLADVISATKLKRLVARQGYMIVYAHLGKNGDGPSAIAPESVRALRYLAELNQQGQIYVTTTAKLLKYHFAHQSLRWTSQQVAGRTRIQIEMFDDAVEGTRLPTLDELQGLTFYVADSDLADIFLGEKKLVALQRNAADDSGRQSVTVPFTRLQFPDV